MLDPNYPTHIHGNKKIAVKLWLQDIPSPCPSTAFPANHAVQQHIVPFDQPCVMVRASEKSLSHLTSSGTVLLFTPVIRPAGTVFTKASSTASHNNPGPSPTAVDPFESLGRALSRFHNRIRHVPYVPKIGFTETHDVFLRQADAVIVVMCEPESGRHEGLGNQADFAESAHEALPRTIEFPMIVIQCGNPDASWWPDASHFETLLKCRTYDHDMAQTIARKLFQ